MARDGSGGYSLPEPAFEFNTTIDEVAMNSILDDIATEIANSVDKDGQTVWTGNMDAGGFKVTNAGDASSGTDLATLGQTTGGGKAPAMFATTVGGTVNAITLTPATAISAYAKGQGWYFLSAGTNTSTVTVNVSGVGAVALKKRGGNALEPGDLPAAGGLVHIVHDGTDFEWANEGNAKECSFLAEVGVGQAITSTVTVNFDTERHDTGSDYDGANTFTAPATGRYMFSIMLRTSSSAPVDQDAFTLSLVTTARTFSHTYIVPRSSIAQSTGFSVVAEMTKGDTAYVQMGRTIGTGTWTTNSGGYNFFSGHLLK